MKRYLTLVLLFLIITSCITTPVPITRNKELKDSWANEIIYSLIIDRFSNGNKRNDFKADNSNKDAYLGGDLKGLNNNIDFLNKLNVSSILTNPLMDSSNNAIAGKWGFEGKWIIDHYKLDEHHGTNEDLKSFILTSRENNKKLILSLILSHVYHEHPWAEKHPEWFHKKSKAKLNLKDNMLPLNHMEPKVFNELINYTKHWIDVTKASGIKINIEGEIDIQFLRQFIFEINTYVKQKHNIQNFLFLADYPDSTTSDINKLVKCGFNAAYNYPLYESIVNVFSKNRSLTNLSQVLKEQNQAPVNFLLTNFLDSTGTNRFLNTSKRVNYKDLRQALAYLMTINGLPIIYYGTESHFTQKNTPYNQKYLNFQKPPSFRYISKLNNIRQSTPSLTKGNFEIIMESEHLLVYKKTIRLKEDSLVVITRGYTGNSISVDTANSRLQGLNSITDKISNRRFPIKNGKLNLNLKKNDIVILTN